LSYETTDKKKYFSDFLLNIILNLGKILSLRASSQFEEYVEVSLNCESFIVNSIIEKPHPPPHPSANVKHMCTFELDLIHSYTRICDTNLQNAGIKYNVLIIAISDSYRISGVVIDTISAKLGVYLEVMYEYTPGNKFIIKAIEVLRSVATSAHIQPMTGFLPYQYFNLLLKLRDFLVIKLSN